MTLLDLAHTLMLQQRARQGEQAAEARARRRLLAIARAQSWPAMEMQTTRGCFHVEGRAAWQRCAREWRPVTVIAALHTLYLHMDACEQTPGIAEGMTILDINGERVGTVAALALAPDTGTPTCIRLRRGRLVRQQIDLPLTWVQDLAEEGVLLNVSKREIEGLATRA